MHRAELTEADFSVYRFPSFFYPRQRQHIEWRRVAKRYRDTSVTSSSLVPSFLCFRACLGRYFHFRLLAIALNCFLSYSNLITWEDEDVATLKASHGPKIRSHQAWSVQGDPGNASSRLGKANLPAHDLEHLQHLCPDVIYHSHLLLLYSRLSSRSCQDWSVSLGP